MFGVKMLQEWTYFIPDFMEKLELKIQSLETKSN